MRKILLLTILSILSFTAINAQIGLGLVVGNDIYQRYTNPEDESGTRSAGNAILNLHLGPKVWIGGQNFSISVESHANWGSTALSLSDYKGMGSVAFPFIAKLNFGSNSGFNSEMAQGWSIGGGYQFAKTELYGLQSTARSEGLTREIFPVYIGEIAYGYGFGGAVIELFGRYGWNPDTYAQTLNIGVSYNLNFVGLIKLARKMERFGN